MKETEKSGSTESKPLLTRALGYVHRLKEELIEGCINILPGAIAGVAGVAILISEYLYPNRSLLMIAEGAVLVVAGFVVVALSSDSEKSSY